MGLNIAEGDRILVGGYVHEDFATTVVAAVSDATAITTSAKASDGSKANIAGAGGDITGQTRALYVVQGNERTVPTIVTEAFCRHHLPLRRAVLEPWLLRRWHRPVQVLQGLQQRQLRHAEHARRLS